MISRGAFGIAAAITRRSESSLKAATKPISHLIPTLVSLKYERVVAQFVAQFVAQITQKSETLRDNLK